MHIEDKHSVIIPLVVFALAFAAVFAISIGLHYASTGTLTTTYRVVRTEILETPVYIAQCSRWYEPSYSQTKTFIISVDITRGTTNADEQLWKATNYMSTMVDRVCEETPKEIVVKQIP